MKRSAAEEHDITNCGASTITTLSPGAEVTMLVIDSKGIVVSNHPKKAFDNTNYHSVRLVRMVAGQRVGTTFARYMDAGGDTVVGETTITPTEATWRFLEGSGKWKGITGGGKAWPITNAKPILPGTSQGCVRATGTYETQKERHRKSGRSERCSLAAPKRPEEPRRRWIGVRSLAEQ